MGETCMDYEVEGVRTIGRPKKIEVVEKDCQTQQLNTEDAMGRSKWRKLIKILNNTKKGREPVQSLIC